MSRAVFCNKIWDIVKSDHANQRQLSFHLTRIVSWLDWNLCSVLTILLITNT